jgi:hypothetical protein
VGEVESLILVTLFCFIYRILISLCFLSFKNTQLGTKLSNISLDLELIFNKHSTSHFHTTTLQTVHAIMSTSKFVH